MKKAYLIFVFMLLSMLQALGQIASIAFRPISVKENDRIEINLESNRVDFSFTFAEEFQNGLGAGGDYSIYGFINSNVDWELQMMATPFYHSDGVTRMDLNNVGVEVKFYGKNKVKNWAKNITVPLSTFPSLLITKQGVHSNVGKEKENAFGLVFEMGTKRQGMNKQSLLDQGLKSGIYQTDVTFLVTKYMDW